MQHVRTSCLAAAVALVALPVLAGPPIMTRVVIWKVKPGMEAKFEEGLKRHNDLHKKQSDPQPHHTYQVQSGPNTGAYVRVAGGRKWEDFDAEAAWGKIDQADSALNTDPYLASTEVSYWALLPDVSRPDTADTPAAMYALWFYRVKFDKADEFNLAIKKINDAIGKTQWPVRYAWFSLVNGGDYPQYALSAPREKFADFNPPAKAFDAMMEEAVGKAEAAAVDEMFERSVAGTTSEILGYRADLSYVPAKK